MSFPSRIVLLLDNLDIYYPERRGSFQEIKGQNHNLVVRGKEFDKKYLIRGHKQENIKIHVLDWEILRIGILAVQLS